MSDEKDIFPQVEYTYMNAYITFIVGNDILNVRLTKSEHERIFVRAKRENEPRANTFANRFKLAWAILWSKPIPESVLTQDSLDTNAE